MDDIIQVQDQFYILATSSRIDEHARVLKHGDTFAVHDRLGNIQRVGLGEQGLYHGGTRFLSRLELRCDGRRPLLLSSSVTENNAVLMADLTNPDYSGRAGTVTLPRNTIHIARTSFLWNGARYERVRLRNYTLEPVETGLSIEFAADFADIFEVRGVKRERRGTLLPPELEPSSVRLLYEGLDGVVRRATLSFAPGPAEVTPSRAQFHCVLPPHAELSYYITVSCESLGNGNGEMTALSFDEALVRAGDELNRSRAADATVATSNQQLNEWLNRSAADLHLMITRTRHGPYPYAGVPWFSTFFGRDGIIAALEYLWINPEIARGVLGYLAAEQATEENAEEDAEPGKILHESRRGEMAALHEVPFGRYYGSVDSTPLFVLLAGAYFERTGDLAFIRQIWPHIVAALEWIDTWGDRDGDGFVEYQRHSSAGLPVQGWRDSADAVFHADGSLAEGPMALCEVQGYVYAARQAAARLAGVLGQREMVQTLHRQAEELRTRFEGAFWCEELSTYAMALDGRKRPCRVRSSTPGHCLFSGIVSRDRAARTAATLMSESAFSGWGVRTVAAGEVRYNPMAYHNGSVWPHDNALIASGLARYGLMPEALRIFDAMFDASLFVEWHRMPELYCGFTRRPDEGPTLYPVACAPQSWAAAAAFSLLQSMLGLSIDAPHKQVRFARPMLPESIERLWVRDLRIGEAAIDLLLERSRRDVRVELLRRTGEIDVLNVK